VTDGAVHSGVDPIALSRNRRRRRRPRHSTSRRKGVKGGPSPMAQAGARRRRGHIRLLWCSQQKSCSAPRDVRRGGCRPPRKIKCAGRPTTVASAAAARNSRCREVRAASWYPTYGDRSCRQEHHALSPIANRISDRAIPCASISCGHGRKWVCSERQGSISPGCRYFINAWSVRR